MFRAHSAEGGGFHSADWTCDFVWLVDQANQQVGPLSTLQLALAAKNGLLTADALIWREGLPRWFAAEEIAGLLPAGPPPRTPYHTVAASHTAQVRRSEAVDRFVTEHATRGPVHWSSPVSTTPSQQPDEPFERLRALLHRRDADAASIAIATAPATGEILPALRQDKPPMTPAAAASFSFTEHLARNVADSIVHVLERHRIRTFDDLATGDRLRQLAVLVVDNLPGTVRLGLGTTIGRAVVETKIVELLEFILFNIPRHHRQRDLRDVIEEFVPQLARAFEDAVAAAASKVGSFMMSNITQAVTALRNAAPANAPAPMLPSPVT